MTQQWRSAAPGRDTREDSALKLLSFGVFVVCLPLFLMGTAIGKALIVAIPFGVLAAAIGGALLLLGERRPAEPETFETPEHFVDPAPVPPRGLPPRPAAWSRAVFDVIEWRRFEALVEAMFQQAGFTTKAQSHGADGGVDVWVYSPNQPEHAACLVQCKHYRGRQIGVAMVRELLGVMVDKKVERGFFATTSTFSTDAVEFASRNPIDLLDVHGLLASIAKRSPDQQQVLLDVALEGEYWRPTCASCGIKTVARSSKDGEMFWGCVNSPPCTTRFPIRFA